MIETKSTLIIKRTFQAPRERVFAAWTQAEALKKWWGTEGHTVPSVEMDFSVGGKYRVEMRTKGTFFLKGRESLGAGGLGLPRNPGELERRVRRDTHQGGWVPGKARSSSHLPLGAGGGGIGISPETLGTNVSIDFTGEDSSIWRAP